MSNIEIINASCADMNVDAVVNAANRNLWSGGGICRVIYKKAGYEELNDACKTIKTPLNDGDAVITPSFKMKNVKAIIHTVGPDFNRNPNAIHELYNAYYNSLKILKENNLHSIAFPLISSGIFAGNIDKPAKMSTTQAINAFNKFIKDNSNYDISVKLCAYSIGEYNEIKDLL